VATLISLPRDLWVFIPPVEGRGGYWGRINEAYSVGMGQVDRNDTRVPYQKHDAGGQLAAKVAAQILGLPIDYWVSLDFVGFRRFIDALGGVEVNVERAFVDTRYPANDDATVDPSYKTVRFEAGRQRMNGQQAIEFARSRYAPEDGSDFGRARRQQLLMTAVKEQIFRVETIPKAFNLLDAVEGHFYTSFSFAEARDLAGWAQEQARDKRPITIRGIVLETGNLLLESTSPGGAYILLPRGGQGEYGAIQRYVRDTFAGILGTPSVGGTPRSSATPVTPAFGVPSPTVTPRPRGGN
jgi:LCP family protein required for cell wall assembly